MSNINSVIQKRNERVERQRTIADAAVTDVRGLTAEETSEIAAIQAEVKGLDDTIAAHRSSREADRLAATVETDVDPTVLTGGERSNPELEAATTRAALGGWMRGNASQEQRSILTPTADQLSAVAPEYRNLSTSGAAALVPTQQLPEIMKYLYEESVINSLAKDITTGDGGELKLPFRATRADVVAEVAEGDAIPFGQATYDTKSFGSWKFAGGSKINFELLQDAQYDIVGETLSELGENLGTKRGLRLAKGNGTTTCEGLFTGLSVGVTTASTTAITSDELFQLKYSVGAKYRKDAQWVTSDSLILAARLLKDDNGQPLWFGGLGSNDPDSLLGAPLYVDVNVDAPAAAKNVAAYGNIKKAFTVRNVGQPVIIKISEAFVATEGAVGFVIWHRSDSKVVDANAAKVLKTHA